MPDYLKKRIQRRSVKSLKNQSIALNFSERKKSYFHILFIDYGAFSGALIGAVGTIVAGVLAWQGVQVQLNQMVRQNQLSEASLLRTEIDKLYLQNNYLDTLLKITHINNFHPILGMHAPLSAIEDSKPSKELRDFINSFQFLTQDQKSDFLKGGAGDLGDKYVVLESRIIRIKDYLIMYDKSIADNSSSDRIHFRITSIKLAFEHFIETEKDYRLLPLAVGSKIKHNDKIIAQLEKKLISLRSSALEIELPEH